MKDELPLEIDCRSVQANLARDEHYLLIDCREQDEWDLVHIDGARLIPMSALAARAAELEPYRDQPIAVHCHHGGRSLRVVNWLRGQGFTRAQSVAGGIDQWALDIDPNLLRY
jgi:rhodanese-related sulfurtransferase